MTLDGSALAATALVFLPDPQVHGSFRPILALRAGANVFGALARSLAILWRMRMARGICSIYSSSRSSISSDVDQGRRCYGSLPDIGFREMVELAGKYGFSSIMILGYRCEGTAAENRRLLADNGVTRVVLDGMLCMLPRTPAEAVQPGVTVDECSENAERICLSLLGQPHYEGDPSTPTIEFVDKLGPLCERAASHGLSFGMEVHAWKLNQESLCRPDDRRGCRRTQSADYIGHMASCVDRRQGRGNPRAAQGNDQGFSFERSRPPDRLPSHYRGRSAAGGIPHPPTTSSPRRRTHRN